MARFNVEFSDDVAAMLERMAEKQGTSKAEILRRALNLEKWFTDTTEQGGRLLVERDGVVREIIKL